MSSAVKYYNSHKEQVLKYKKEFYYNKTKKYSLFKNIKIKGYTKKQSNFLIKTAIDNNNILILINDNDYISFDNFIKLYKFKDFSIIEIEAYDDSDCGFGCCNDIPYEHIKEFYIKFDSNHKLTLSIYDSFIIKTI